MGPFTVGLLVPLGVFAMIFGIVYIVVTARNRERMALIEKGADPRLFESMKINRQNRAIKWGIILVGIGIGVVVAEILVKNEVMSEDSAYTAMIFIFGGAALIASHFLLKKKEIQE